MSVFGRWPKNNGYAVELEEGRRVVLEELRAARSERSGELERLVARVSRRLHAVVVARKARFGRRKKLACHTARPAELMGSAADYRSDAALGHFAGAAEKLADVRSVAGRSSKIAA
jgi:hypothetical protein